MIIAALVAIGILSWVWAGRCERRQRERDAELFGLAFGNTGRNRERLLADPDYQLAFGNEDDVSDVRWQR